MAIERDELPLVGGLSTGGGVVADLLLNSGDLAGWLVVFVMDHIGTLMGVMAPLNRLAEKVAWLPADLLGDVVTILLWVSVAVSLSKLVVAFIDS